MDILALLTIPYGIISIAVLVTFFIMAIRLRKIYHILDHFYKKDLSGESK